MLRHGRGGHVSDETIFVLDGHGDDNADIFYRGKAEESAKNACLFALYHCLVVTELTDELEHRNADEVQ